MRAVILLLLCVPCLVSAGSLSYSCEVKSEFYLASSGSLESGNQLYVGSKFNVEKRTGVVSGTGVGNSSYPTKQVIDVGSEEQSYQLIWISREVIGIKGAHNSVYLRVQENHEGMNKPFIMNMGSKTLTGICK
ncbi:hypothetical protein [Neptuniibacter caesariensis]|nr:hypothetical protein [Neptuniibacter caesariensis]